MSKDQSYGLVIFLISIIVAIVYLIAFFGQAVGLFQTSTWHDLAVGIPVLLFVLLVLVISGWIGWTMLTTPPPAPLEPEAPTTPATSGSETSRSDSSTTPRRRTGSRLRRRK